MSSGTVRQAAVSHQASRTRPRQGRRRAMAQPTLATDRHDHPARPGPVRLTRRGRAVVGAIMVVCVTATSALLWLVLGGPALASGGAGPGRQPGTGMLRVVVGPRQTLWSI